MTTEQPVDSSAVRFLDNFLQEKNIKWVLAAGMLTLLGSSLMMVMPHWSTFAPLAKFGTIMAYTAAIYGVGWCSYHKLLLRKTGTGLLALSVLLIPITCAAWPWAWRGAEGAGETGVALFLLGLQASVAAVVSRATWRHFLRADQWTFVLCYWALSLAGAVIPILELKDSGTAGVVAVVLWLLFAFGVTKVNRHVFWLTEEHRQPRILGFFPILLLGSQFLVITAVHCLRHFTVDWIGLGCVLVAIPILLTADAIAAVFQQRTGNLVRPLPKSILLPIVVSLVGCAAGMSLAAIPLAQRLPYALVPTASLVAVVMAVVARRTGKSGFVWAMILAATVAYNFSPIFFQGLARAAISQGAAAVREAKLPLAFYGLTYLPLILGTAAASWVAGRRGSRLFSLPLRSYSLALCYLTLAVSCTHPKAMLLVSLAMTAVLSGLTIAFRDRRVALGALLALLLASVGLTPFLRAVGWAELPLAWNYLCPLSMAVCWMLAAPFIDPRLKRIPWGDDGEGPESLVRGGSLLVTLLIATAWIPLSWFTEVGRDPLAGGVIGIVLLVQSLVWIERGLSWFTLAFLVSLLARVFAPQADSILNAVTFLLLGQWGATYWLSRIPQSRLARAWGAVAAYASLYGLLMLVTTVGLPGLIIQSYRGPQSSLDWLRPLLLVAWSWDAARRLWNRRLSWLDQTTENGLSIDANVAESRLLNRLMVACGYLGVFGIGSLALTSWLGVPGSPWHPLLWSVVASGGLLVVRYVRRRHVGRVLMEVEDAANRRLQAIEPPMTAISLVVLAACSFTQLFYFPLPARMAAAVGLVALFLWTHVHGLRGWRIAVVAAANWSLLELVCQLMTPGVTDAPHLLFHISELGRAGSALAASLSLFGWMYWTRQKTTPVVDDSSRDGDGQREEVVIATLVEAPSQQVADDLVLIQGVTLRLWIGWHLVALLGVGSHAGIITALVALTMASLAVSELVAAVRLGDERRVWMAEGVAAAAVVWFKIASQIDPPLSLEMFLLLGGAVAFHLAGRWSLRGGRTRLMAQPFLATANILPLATVLFGVAHSVLGSDVGEWRGARSLAILLAGGYYFWQAIERRSSRFAVLSAVILDVALALLARELRLNDPQFYLVPVGISILVLVQTLKREIPGAWLDPLRYAGALTILVSPTFHILHGSWLHLLSLMVGSMLLLLVAIGLRVRALMYTSVAFLVADLIAMVVCGGLDHPNWLWVSGVLLGAALIGLGALCELHRERLLQRLRLVSAQLRQWE